MYNNQRLSEMYLATCGASISELRGVKVTQVSISQIFSFSSLNMILSEDSVII